MAPEAISDTGPPLHLHEIDCLGHLAPLSPLAVPDLVRAELAGFGLREADFAAAGLQLMAAAVDEAAWQEALRTPELARIQPADAQVFVLAQRLRLLVLTDDLALREILEQHGSTVVGSVGLLVRAYAAGRLDREALEHAIDALCTRSTLHLSRPFREYLRRLLSEIG